MFQQRCRCHRLRRIHTCGQHPQLWSTFVGMANWVWLTLLGRTAGKCSWWKIRGQVCWSWPHAYIEAKTHSRPRLSATKSVKIKGWWSPVRLIWRHCLVHWEQERLGYLGCDCCSYSVAKVDQLYERSSSGTPHIQDKCTDRCKKEYTILRMKVSSRFKRSWPFLVQPCQRSALERQVWETSICSPPPGECKTKSLLQCRSAAQGGKLCWKTGKSPQLQRKKKKNKSSLAIISCTAAHIDSNDGNRRFNI